MLINFVDKVTAVTAAWLNKVDVLLDTVFGAATTKADARAALTSDAPMSVAQGGTGATTAAGARAALGAAASGANTDITSLNAPALGAATATTQAAGDSSTKVATTAMVQAAIIASLVSTTSPAAKLYGYFNFN